MQLVYSKYKDLSQITSETHPLEIFDNSVISFLNDLSKKILKNTEVRFYPDVATFAFFCRKSNILKIQEEYKSLHLRLGRGVVFHVAPSNVPVNFAYSLVCGLLAGNKNIIKIPSKDFDQIKLIVKGIEEVFNEKKYPEVAEKIVLVRYPREDKESTDLLSKNCDVRIIWGGDETINNIRKSTTPVRSFDITFADRYSFCIINAENYLKEEKKKNLALNFFNDTYLFDQNACTAPHLVIWTGSDKSIEEAQHIFWANLLGVLNDKKYEIESIIAVDKLTSLYNQAILSEGKPTKIDTDDNLMWRVKIDKLTKEIDEYRSKKGYFLEYTADNLEDLGKIINQKYQTLSYFGFEKDELKDLYKKLMPLGIDRIVPIGTTMDFEVTWDGYNLINTLSRVCVMN